MDETLKDMAPDLLKVLKRVEIEMGSGGRKAEYRAIDLFSAKLVKQIREVIAKAEERIK